MSELGFFFGVLVGVAASKVSDLLLAMWSEWQMQRLMRREEAPSDD